MPKPTFEEQEIVQVEVTGVAAAIVFDAEDDNVDAVKEALDPNNFPEQKQKMNTVRKLVEDLDTRELLLTLQALKHAVASPAHQGNVSFALQETDYEIEGIGLEISDEAIEEEDGESTPIAIVFIKQTP